MSLVGNLNRSMRTIFVGDIPNEVTEGNLKDLFSEYGPVLNVRLFKDVSSQYAFCEYGEPEVAARAIHSLGNYSVKGRALRVGIAENNRTKEELASLQQFMCGDSLDALQAMDVTEKAPEEISKAVASLPAEQMFELMKQMKMCIENNPQEARNLLLQNPQLAYALLQAQVIMRIVDPEVALKILDRPNPGPTEPETKSVEMKPVLPIEPTSPAFASAGDKDMRQLPPADFDMRSLAPATGDQDMRPVSGDLDLRTMVAGGGPSDARPFDPRFRPADPRAMPSADPRSIPSGDPRAIPSADPRAMPSVDPRVMPSADPRSMQSADPRAMQGMDPRSMQNMDPRAMQNVDPRSVKGIDPRAMQQGVDPRMMQGADPRMMPGADPRVMPGADPRMMQGTDPRMMPGTDPRMMPGADPRMMQGADPRMMQGLDPRMMAGSDPRSVPGGDPRGGHGMDPRGMAAGDRRPMSGADAGVRGQQGPAFGPRSAANIDPRVGYDPRSAARGEDPRKQPPAVGAAMHAGFRNPLTAPPSAEAGIPEDEEKAALIMQVLQLSEEQISLLPPEQRQSIMVLKEQIARSQLTM